MSDLWLVTLPIGNNNDLTPRARSILESGKQIIAEDTRKFRDFCKHNLINLEGKLVDSYHDHSDQLKLSKILNWLNEGDVLLVSDAGSPIVSDPAYPMIVEALKQGHQIKSAPGVSSVIVALELAGLPPSPWHFHAFLPREGGKKEKFFKKLGEQNGTHLFFEGVSRVENSVDLLVQIYPNASFAICRELTKDFESVYRFDGRQWPETKKQIIWKGEFVILVHINNEDNTFLNNSKLTEIAQEVLEQGNHPKLVSKLISEILNKPTKEVYQLLSKKVN